MHPQPSGLLAEVYGQFFGRYVLLIKLGGVRWQGVVAALGETIRLMGAIDEAIDDHGGWPLS